MYVQCKVYIQLWRRLKAYNRVIYVQNRPETCKKNVFDKPSLLEPNLENKEALGPAQSDTNSSQYTETEDYSMEILHVWTFSPLTPSAGTACVLHPPGHKGAPRQWAPGLRSNSFCCLDVIFSSFVCPIYSRKLLANHNESVCARSRIIPTTAICTAVVQDLKSTIQVVCVDVSALVLMESLTMHISTFYFPVLKTPLLILWNKTLQRLEDLRCHVLYSCICICTNPNGWNVKGICRSDEGIFISYVIIPLLNLVLVKPRFVFIAVVK